MAISSSNFIVEVREFPKVKRKGFFKTELVTNTL